MQRYVKFVVLFLLISAVAWGAFPSGVAFDVQPGTGSDNNGCGFVPGSSGTDYSEASTPHYALTGLTSAGAGNVVVYASASADMVGNVAQVISGTNFNTGFFEISSVSVGVSITFSLNAAGSSIVTGVGASGVLNIGGTCATVAKAYGGSVASNSIYLKGTLTVTSALTFTTDSHASPGIPFGFIGYTSSHGDGGQATWTTATNSTDLVDINQANNVLFQNIIFTNTAGTPAAGLHSGTGGSGNSLSVYVINCKFSGFTVAINGDFTLHWAFSGLFVVNTRVTASTSHGIVNAAPTYIQGSMLDNNTGDGLNLATSGQTTSQGNWHIQNTVIYKNGANGINISFSDNGGTVTYVIIVDHCDISTNTGAGVVMSNVTDPMLIAQNSIFDANGTYGVDTGSTSETLTALLYDNAFYNNTTAATRGVNAGLGTITLTASPYKTLGSNFALNSTSGGGAALLNAGFPGVIPGAGTGYTSVGALEPQSSSGGGQKAFAIIQ